MPIYEQRYRRLDASVPLRAHRWLPIAREGLKALFAKKVFLVILGFAWLPALGQLVSVYISTRLGTGAGGPFGAGPRMFADFFSRQILAVIVMSVFSGAALIANDLKTGGILLYLSRPLTLFDYVGGKAAIVLGSLAAITTAPGLFLFMGARSLAPEQLGGFENLAFAPKIVLHSFALILPAAAVILAVSSLSKTPRFAGLAFLFLFVGSEFARAIAWSVTRNPMTGLISMQACVRRLGEAIFDLAPHRATAGIPPWGAAVVLAIVCLISLLVLHRRVRAVEIVR